MLSPDVKKRIADADVLAAIDEMESNLNDVTKESIGRKGKIRDYESKISALTSQLKKVGFDPDSDLEEQLSLRDAKSKEGYKPASEYELLSKKMEKISNEMMSWKQEAEKSQNEAILAKTKAAFSGKLGDHFGKAADMILDYASLKGIIAHKDGEPGVIIDDEFTPLNATRGKNAIDVLKGVYSNFAITKQQQGSSNVSTKASSQSTGDVRTASMEEFESLPHAQKQEFVKSGGKIE